MPENIVFRVPSKGRHRVSFARPRAWAPHDVSGCIYSFEARQLTPLADGTAVATLPNSTGQGNSYTQSVAGKRGLYRVNVANGQPSIEFDNADDGYDGGPTFDSGAFTVMAVVRTKEADASKSRTLLGAGAGAAARLGLMVGFATPLVSITRILQADSVSDQVLTAPQTAMLTWRAAAGISAGSITVDVWENLTPGAASLTLATLTQQNGSVLGNDATAVTPLNMHLLALAIWNRALPTETRLEMYSYFKALYGLP
jgi:hypothetical protein